MKKSNVQLRVQLTLPAKNVLTHLSDQTGITQIALMSRLSEWFAKQPDVVQAAVLNLYPPSIRKDVAKLILKRPA